MPYRERRAILEALDLEGPHWFTVERIDDGEALWAAVLELELEGVVAKRLDRYVPGQRGWVKRESPLWARGEAERESALRHRERRRVLA